MATGPQGLPNNVVAALLHKLGNDDQFRELFQRDTVEALRQVGAPDPEGCAPCMKVTKLADKATIRASGDALTAQLTGALALVPIHLNAR